MWIEREICAALQVELERRPVVVLTGARQSGKTSLLRHLLPDRAYVSLDLPLLAEEAEQSGEAFLRKHPPPLIVDEVQNAPGLFRYLKAKVDERRDGPGQYVLTGSAKFPLTAGVSESLAGRAAIVELHSLSLAELEAWSGQAAEGDRLLQWCLLGGYPEVHARSLPAERFHADYVATYLERDVRSALQVRSLRDFDRFLRLLALRSGQLLSLNSLASDTGIAVNTVKSWLSVLEASNIVYLLPPYYRNLGKRLVKTPKAYLLDTGLLCFLLGIRTVSQLKTSALLGQIFETLALGQILRRFTNRLEPLDLYFYRDQYGHEVDFVIPVGEKLRLIECKYTELPGRVPGFVELEKAAGVAAIVDRIVVTPRPAEVELPHSGMRLRSVAHPLG